jgi:hypothetical protein
LKVLGRESFRKQVASGGDIVAFRVQQMKTENSSMKRNRGSKYSLNDLSISKASRKAHQQFESHALDNISRYLIWTNEDSSELIRHNRSMMIVVSVSAKDWLIC